MSRREREHRQRQLLYIFTAIAGAIVIISLVVGASYQYYFYPRQTLASVDGQEIQRRDYWKVRELQLRQNIAQQIQQLQFLQEDQAQQVRDRIAMSQEELLDVPGAPVDPDTLGGMIDDLVILQSMDSLGLSVTDAEVNEFIAEQFAPVPLSEPTPTATFEPTAEAWATATGEAFAAEATQSFEATATAFAELPTATPDGTQTPSPDVEPTGTPDVEVTGTPVATETPNATVSPGTETPATDGTPDSDATPADGTPTAEATAEPTTTPTPSADEARATSEAIYDLFKENYLDEGDMSRSDYARLVVRPQIARTKVREYLANAVPTRTEQVHAKHILVQTREAADAVVERLQTEEFDDVAREVSTDTGTAGSGGDLGWFPRELMVEPFANAAFALEPGQTSEPVQTEFGWHIIHVIEKEADRPLTISTLRSIQGSTFDQWLREQRRSKEISATVTIPELEEDAGAEVIPDFFQPPPDAPIPPTPTQVTPPTPVEETPEANGSPTPEEDETPEPAATSTP